ncbi:MAG: D-alanine--D-alanine ligase [Bdellovibrionota bacterium]
MLKIFNQDTVVGVLYGGLSKEREVSLKTGKAVFAALQSKGYQNAVLIDVGQGVAKTLQEHRVTCAYIALHGRYGEDGCIQGLLECMGIPYTGVGVFSSALAMDKYYTKKILASEGLPVLPTFLSDANMSFATVKEGVESSLSYPMIAKPVSEGSTFGLQIVKQEQQLEKAWETAHTFDTRVLWEPYVSGTEYTVAIIQDHAYPVIQIEPLSGLYDYQAKYEKGKTKFTCPAPISETLTQTLQHHARRSAQALRTEDFCRVDFIYDGKHPWILEVNTMPGMTETSLVPMAAKANQVVFEDLVESLLQTASLKCKP